MFKPKIKKRNVYAMITNMKVVVILLKLLIILFLRWIILIHLYLWFQVLSMIPGFEDRTKWSSEYSLQNLDCAETKYAQQWISFTLLLNLSTASTVCEDKKSDVCITKSIKRNSKLKYLHFFYFLFLCTEKWYNKINKKNFKSNPRFPRGYHG